MKIEMAPESYKRLLTWDESVLYCFALNIDGKIGWRLPTGYEYLNLPMSYCWTQTDSQHSNNGLELKYYCYPVRDLTDD